MPFDPEVGGQVYSGQNGTLILEAETTAMRGAWSKVNVDGEASILWNSDRSNYRSVEESETLRYTFQVDEGGVYSLAMHSARIKSVMNDSDRFENGVDGAERTDTGNDAYVALKDAVTGEVIKVATKLFTGLGASDRDLRWGTKFDDSSGHYDATLRLEAGRVYDLEIIGRSDGYVLDRMTLNKGGFLRDEDAAPSSKVMIPANDSTDPVVPVAPDSPSTDDPEPTTASDDGGGGPFQWFFDILEGIFDAIAGVFGGGGDDDEVVASAPLISQSDEIVLLSDIVPSTGEPEIQPTNEADEDDLSDAIIA